MGPPRMDLRQFCVPAHILKDDGAGISGSSSGRQLRLRECSKVVVLDKPLVLHDASDVLRLKAALQQPHAAPQELLTALRTLAVCELSYDVLLATHVGEAVRPLRGHGDVAVATLAHKLLEGWRAIARAAR